MSHVAVHQSNLRYPDGAWLLLAVALHLLLLLIPSGKDSTRRAIEPADLVVRLMAIAAAPRQPAPEAVAEPEPEAPAEPAETPPLASPLERVEPDEPALRVEEETRPAPPSVSAARLIDLRDSVTARVPMQAHNAQPSLGLGTPREFERPQNWQPGTGAEALAPFDNTFNGKTVPNKVVVVDRWLAADGSHNVIVETPAGLRMCGSARPWDPTQPLVEHIMMWRVCGGDGARPLEFKPREKLDRDFIDTLAKDATEP